MLPLDLKQPPHGLQDIFKRSLDLRQAPGDLDLDAGEYGYFLPDHLRRNLHFRPAANIRPPRRRSMKGSGILKDEHVFRVTHNLTGPAHPGVDAEQALLGRDTCKYFAYAV